MSSVHEATGLRVGMRVAIGTDRATVRYLGPVRGQAGAWAGLEWDDSSRGRHDGSIAGGPRYFSCVDHPTAGSFVRAEKVRVPRTVEQALLERYCAGAQAAAATSGGESASASSAASSAASLAPVLLPTASGRRLVEVQLVGEARVRERLANTRLLTSARLVDAGIGRAVEGEEEVEAHGQEAGDGADGATAAAATPAATAAATAAAAAERRLESLAPNLAELDLSGNLLSDWSQVGALCRALPALRVLDLSGNRVRLPAPPRTQLPPSLVAPSPSPSPPLPPLRLRTLVLNDCAASVTWPALVALVAGCLPELTDLHARRCGLRSLALGEEKEGKEEAAVAAADGAGTGSGSSPPPPPEPAALPSWALDTLRTLDLEGNALGSWREVERLRALPRLERLQLSGNPLGRVWCRPQGRGAAAAPASADAACAPACAAASSAAEAQTPALPPPPFTHLTALTLGACGLSRWSDVDALDALLPRLGELRLSGNPLTDDSPGGGRYEAVARSSALALLNGAAVRLRERRDSELRYVHGLLADAHEAAGPAGVAALVAEAERGGVQGGGGAAAAAAAATATTTAATAAAERLAAQNPRLLPLLRRCLAEAEALAASGGGSAAFGGGVGGGGFGGVDAGPGSAFALAAAAGAADAAGGAGGAQGALAALAAAAALAARSTAADQQQQQEATAAAAAAAPTGLPAAPPGPAAAFSSSATAAAAAEARTAVILGSSATARRGAGGGGTLASTALDVTAAVVTAAAEGGATGAGAGAEPPLPRCRLPPSATMGVVAALLRRMMPRTEAVAAAKEQDWEEEEMEDSDRDGGAAGRGRAGAVRVALVPAASSAAATSTSSAAAASSSAAIPCWEEADEDARLGDVVAGLPGGPYAAGGWDVAVQVA